MSDVACGLHTQRVNVINELILRHSVCLECKKQKPVCHQHQHTHTHTNTQHTHARAHTAVNTSKLTTHGAERSGLNNVVPTCWTKCQENGMCLGKTTNGHKKSSML